ncbi:MAG: hypothetical protein ACRDI0_00080 [Actinomycetota bacterium]
MSYREHPVFFPSGQEHLCAVVCVPTGDLKDLGVVLLSGGNITRTHRNSMWVRAAREMADRGIASIRFDYHGIGDSTVGSETEFDLDAPFEGDVIAAAGFLRRATGVTGLALVATCFGARTALVVAAEQPDVLAMTLFPAPLMSGGRLGTRRRIRRRLRGTGLGKFLRANPLRRWLRRTLRRGRPGGAAPPATRAAAKGVSPLVIRALLRFLRRGGTVSFVYGERGSHLEGLRAAVAAVTPELAPQQRERLRVEIIENVGLQFFAMAEQDIAVRWAVKTVEEFSASLPGGDRREPDSVDAS